MLAADQRTGRGQRAVAPGAANRDGAARDQIPDQFPEASFAVAKIRSASGRRRRSGASAKASSREMMRPVMMSCQPQRRNLQPTRMRLSPAQFPANASRSGSSMIFFRGGFIARELQLVGGTNSVLVNNSWESTDAGMAAAISRVIPLFCHFSRGNEHFRVSRETRIQSL